MCAVLCVVICLLDSLIDEVNAQCSAVAHDFNVLIHVHQLVHGHGAQTLRAIVVGQDRAGGGW